MRRLLIFAILALVGAVGLIALSPEAGPPKEEVAVGERSNGARDERADAAEVPGQYIVTFNRTAESPRTETESRERRQGFEAEYVYKRAVEGFSAELSPRQVERLEADPEVAAVTPDRKVRAVADLVSGEPSPPVGARRIGAATTASARSGSDANVAVIDTGVDLDHPDLNASSGRNCVDTSAPADDDNGHGTHVAGTIAAENDGSGVVGVAPGTKVYAAKVLAGDGSGTTSQVICGIDWVTSTRTDGDPSNDIAVANMSLGGSGPPVGSCATTSDPQHRALCASTAAGVSYVVAAGNDGWDFDYAAEPDTPAAYPEALTVTAIGDSDGEPGAAGAAPVCRADEADDRYASFSNYASTAGGASHSIAAPGVCIRSTWPGGTYNTVSGTSMASPHVAGAVALCLDDAGEAGPCAGLSPARIIERMRAEAAERSRAETNYGFAGDPAQPVPDRYFGNLTWVAEAAAADVTAPSVTSTLPSAGQAGVARSAAVNVSFSEPMNRPSAESAFSLVRASDGARVSGSFSWNANTMTFRPSAALAQGTAYVADLATSAVDATGNPLAAERRWSFKTVTSVSAHPGALAVEKARVRSGSRAQLATDDNGFFAVDSTRTATRTSSWYGRFGRVPNALSNLRVTYRGRSSAGCTQGISIYRAATNRWVGLSSRSVGRTEVGLTLSPPGAPRDYVTGTSGDGEIRIRVRCTRASSSFYTSGDLLRIAYDRP